jgi:prophage regulatory protein
MKDVIGFTGLSRSAIYQKISCNQFPKQVKLGARAVGWLLDEVNNWVEHQVKVSRAG